MTPFIVVGFGVAACLGGFKLTDRWDARRERRRTSTAHKIARAMTGGNAVWK